MAEKVLITQGIRPFAQRVGNLLQARYGVQFGSADEVPHVLLQTGKYVELPRADTQAFEHEVLRACLDSGSDALLPLGEAEIHLLAGAAPLFAEYGIDVWVPHVERMGELTRARNPERNLPLVVLNRGTVVAGAGGGEEPGSLSGVFTPTGDAGGLALCCIAD